MTLDHVDLRMAKVALNYYVQTHIHMKRPVPPAAERLAEHLEEAVSAIGQEPVARQEEWISTAEAAERLGKSERTIRRHAKHIGGKQIGRAWLIPADSLPTTEQEPEHE